MSFKTVQWTSVVRLECAECVPANVIICLDSSIIESGFSTIDATLSNVEIVKDVCGGGIIKYTFMYDDTQIVNQQRLVCSDILGVACRGCLTTYADNIQDWKTYVPTYSGSGGMTFTAVTTDQAFYRRDRGLIFIDVQATGTIGGTPTDVLYATLPISSLANTFQPLAANVFDSDSGGGLVSGVGGITTSTPTGIIRVSKFDGSVWAAGDGGFQVTGFYRPIA